MKILKFDAGKSLLENVIDSTKSFSIQHNYDLTVYTPAIHYCSLV